MAQCSNYNIGVDVTYGMGLLEWNWMLYKYEYDKLSSVTGRTLLPMGGYYFSTANVNKADYMGFDVTLHIRTESEVSAMEPN